MIAEASTRDMVGIAKQLAPHSDGFLKGSIRNEKSKHGYKVVVGAEYGPYVEFGTGKKFNAPQEFLDLAAQFKGKKTGSYEEALRSIGDWLRRKGVNPKEIETTAKQVFFIVLANGLEPRPFLYPAWVKGKQLYIEDLKDLLKKEFK